MPSYQHRDPHVKDKTVSRPSYIFNKESPKLLNTVFILGQGPDLPGTREEMCVYVWLHQALGNQGHLVATLCPISHGGYSPVFSLNFTLPPCPWPHNIFTTPLPYIYQYFITHATVQINDFSGVRATHLKYTGCRSRINDSHCDTALFIPVYDITMAQQ